MTKAPISLQDLRRRLYVKAKTDGLDVKTSRLRLEAVEQGMAVRHAGTGIPRISSRQTLQSLQTDRFHNP